MTADWLTALRRAMESREAAIIDGVLQQPDYPPLPPCPECDVPTERIASGTADPEFGQIGFGSVLVNFAPCGHCFAVPLERLLDVQS